MYNALITSVITMDKKIAIVNKYINNRKLLLCQLSNSQYGQGEIPHLIHIVIQDKKSLFFHNKETTY